jgi:hypothetical protein
MLERSFGYERMLLFMLSVFGNRYWGEMARFYTDTSVHLYNLDAWILAHKEITVVVGKTWMIPLTNVQHIASAYWHDMDANVGYANTLPLDDSNDIIINILEQITTQTQYTFRDAKTQRSTPLAYVEEFRKQTRKLLEPLYRDVQRECTTWDDFVSARVNAVGGGAAGSFAAGVLADADAQGPAKRYVMGKLDKNVVDLYTWEAVTNFSVGFKTDERGPTRPIVAIDAFKALLASYAFSPIHNKYPHVGWDIGESPLQETARYLGLSAISMSAQGSWAMICLHSLRMTSRSGTTTCSIASRES